MRPLKILAGHTRYQQAGGEDVVFTLETDLLRRMGHTVLTYEQSNQQLHDISPVSAFLQAVWSRQTTARLDVLLRDFQPDLAHFHNTFAMISPSAYYACQAAGVPVVQTLSNYRLGCPNASCAVAGQPCERCIAHTVAWPGIVRKCYRESRLATAGVAAITAIHKAMNTYGGQVDAFISTTEFARRIHIRSGLPERRVFVKPNFVVPAPGTPRKRGGYAFYAGRLSQEKGVDVLLAAWSQLRTPLRLVLAGEAGGDCTEAVREATRTNPRIEWVGGQTHEGVGRLLQEADFLIHPSRLYEGCSMVIVEAFNAGVPCLVSGQGSLAEMVEDGHSGRHFRQGDAAHLAEQATWLAAHPAQLDAMGATARSRYEKQFTPERNYALLMEIYQSAITHHQHASQ
jgi:glycosyltransferase involved in cell wall biosynthesis